MSKSYQVFHREVWETDLETSEFKSVAICPTESCAEKVAEAMNACDGVDVPGAIKLLANKTLPPLLDIIERIGGSEWRNSSAVKNARFLLENITPRKP